MQCFTGTNAEIAEELVLSVRVVEIYVLRTCPKLRAERRMRLAHVLAFGGPIAAAGPSG